MRFTKIVRNVDLTLFWSFTAVTESQDGGNMARNVYYVSPRGAYWIVQTAGGYVYSTHSRKEDALEAARQMAYANMPSQVMVQLQNGQWQTEWTYGNDPFPPRG